MYLNKELSYQLDELILKPLSYFNPNWYIPSLSQMFPNQEKKQYQDRQLSRRQIQATTNTNTSNSTNSTPTIYYNITTPVT